MMDYKKFSFTDGSYLITYTTETYGRTKSGKGWKSKPDEVKTEVVNAQFYTNYVQSIPFFNNFGFGAYCRATRNYTVAGYLPVVITTVSPGREVKRVTKFTFTNK
jgi:hypothetical protein